MISLLAIQIETRIRVSLSKQTIVLTKVYSPKLSMYKLRKYKHEKNEIMENIWISTLIFATL